MSEEQLRLLKMIEEHKITAEQGAKLLAALNEAQAARERSEREERRGRGRGAAEADKNLFWGHRPEDSYSHIQAERERLREERERLREEAGRMREMAREEARRVREELRRETSEARRRQIEEAHRAREQAREEAMRAREQAQRDREEARRDREGRRGRATDTTPLSDDQGADGRVFHLRITARETGESKVDLRLPLGMVNFGLKVGAKYLPEDLSFNTQEVLDAVRSGALGKILEVNDPENEHKVEIWIE